MQDEIAVAARSAATDVENTVPDVSIDLRKRPRVKESLIYGFLFLCAAVSIFTTIGIVYELSKESLSFFTRHLWEDVNKPLAVDIDAQATTFALSDTGRTLWESDIIRISDEVMQVVAIDGHTVTVERGFQGTKAMPHSAGMDVFASNRVSLIEFFTRTKWNPQIGEFGILPLVNSTFMTSGFAMLVALPLGLSTAIYLSEYASDRARKILKPILEVLAGIPLAKTRCYLNEHTHKENGIHDLE